MIELGRFFDLASDLMCVLDAGGHCRQINAAFTDILGYSNAALRSQRLVDLAHTDDRAAHQAEIDQLLAGACATANFTGRYQHQDRSWRWLKWNIAVANGVTDASTDESSQQANGQKPWLYCVAR
ncbi:MAG: PAS domain-containing protein, partial [Phormidesmis sp.]